MPVRPIDAAAPLATSPLASRFAVTHFWLPVAIGLPVFTLLMGFGGDQWVADHLFRLEGGHWALQDAWVTRTVVHKAGKWLSTSAALVAILLCVHHWRKGGDRTLRWALLYVVIGMALGTGVISLLKTLVPMECPWDLLRYGGHQPYIGLFTQRPAGMAAQACFPAGHASAGYAWLCLYYFALLWRPSWRWAGLWIGLGTGLVFGIGQQLRGAHFLSHDVATALICWLLSLGLYLIVKGILIRRQLDRPNRQEANA
ncbi:phosphatase PAP2 family protein [Stenotrophomonas muris]|uniref:Phosphatase PAP2 family protein n=1 Tax=Stenotrophomonas muris TaxID=2963283 RepID=A0ABU5MLL5_9GAMM|nr:phosphatase PAP2 family protein [Stenotrophomonas muris]MBH1492087.1 phosphatase PAP2 family protein [Stenotrophomonas maltophilia]MBH1551654.1 phosphatase PAP2 family protein [Stenotrophomonas maltophilia]MBH1572989.1 phosphatase PAP2 family protein [Stenotrophomonas maltophilia]MBH1673550.1 phosphatase PAP2 family protein [Stenotrophomonas maltophilia]MBH1829723.1 phosphatase PAP2 family protein [Stenotrophomonas maltophilia]